MPAKKISPVRQQYLDIKAKHPDAILFFRLGDFYETFDQDAELVAGELDIVLTSRNVAKGNRVPMAGVPHHAAESYLAKLIERGYHVAICEQVGTEPINGLMPRDVVRIVTPGTIFEPGLLPGDGNNFIVAVSRGEEGFGLAYADVSTGEFAATEFTDESSLLAEISRLHPAEVLHAEDDSLPEELNGHQTPLSNYRFELGQAGEAIKGHYKVSTLDGFGLKGSEHAVQAVGALLHYLQQTQSSSLSMLSTPNLYSTSEFMVLDQATRRNLELAESLSRSRRKGSLLAVLDHCITPMGKRLLRSWINKPLLDLAQITQRQDAVESFFSQGLLRTEFREKLKGLADIERLTNRIISGNAQPRDLLSLRETLTKLPPLAALISDKTDPLYRLAQDLLIRPTLLEILHAKLAEEPPAILGKMGIFRKGAAPELDEILNSTQSARDWIAGLEATERQRTGIRVLKVGFNKVHGYYIEITKANSDQAPEEYIRKQTLVNAERYITPELKDMESQVLNAEESIIAIETRLFRALCTDIGEYAQALLKAARSLGALDLLANLAEIAANEGFVRPEVVEEDVLEVHEGRHIVVEKNLPPGEAFIPNDTIFEESERIRIITGPNMSGKSTYLRQIALIVLLAQMGSFVPADKARIGLVDRIFTRIGAQDEIHSGQSTFMVEMVETANILNHATQRSLLILDEIGRGTSTYDGLSIAWAVVEYIHNHPRLQSKTIFATHFHELTQLANQLVRVRNYNVAVSEADGKVVFLHRIIEGGADRSYGIHVGQLAGLPGPVVQRAQEILRELEQDSQQSKDRSTFRAKQEALFPESSPILEELEKLDIDGLAPIEALNKLFEWKKKFGEKVSD